MKSIGLVFVALLLAGCSVVPGGGPSGAALSADDIETAVQKEDYFSFTLTPEIAQIVGRYVPTRFSDYFGIKGTEPRQRIGVGDLLTINIWEADERGIFSTSYGKKTTVESVVDDSGRIFVPYAGRIRAAGQSVESVREAVETALVGKAVQPQVQIIVTGNQTNSAVIVGDVGKPGKYPISVAGTTLLDLVAHAGGSRGKTFETVVTLKRGNRKATTNLQDLIDVPKNNVRLVKGDNILLTVKPRSFTAFGAVVKTAIQQFPTESVTLAEALASVGGLNDNTADASAVYLFRFEDPEVIVKLKPEARDKIGDYQVPVIYRLNLRDPKAWFVARYFQMRDKDMIYVANHPAAELGKFLRIIQPLLTSTRYGVLISNDLEK
ncbi:polysaccharide biosynthesis/export family protein [Breoghania corrubedonensis]|nr:polysaccharide biosynthesis/export family protein [Breoghania corrubedonensis]